MLFYINRYYQSIWKKKRWLPLVFSPAVIYIIIMAVVSDRFSVVQKITISQTAPVAVSTSAETISMEKIASSPSELFLDDFAIRELSKSFEQRVGAERKAHLSIELRHIVENSMSIHTLDNEHILLTYYGNDIKLGKILVNFYVQRLMNRSIDGLMRSTRASNANISTRLQASQPDAVSLEALKPTPQPEIFGELTVKSHKSIWRSDRLLPTIGILAFSLLIFVIAAGMSEWMDPSFKSERQVVRYLDLQIVGVMPNLDQLIQRLQKNS